MKGCSNPFLKNNEGAYIMLPCGKCPNCFKKRVSAWSFRLMEEDKIASSSLFITLTYDIDNVPLTKKGLMTLCKRDVQLFMKRLRKSNPRKLKYYLCGEYGGTSERPHYHMIIFNCDIATLQPAWKLGHIHYGQVSEASVGYTLKYISKPSKYPKFEGDDRLREFAHMSKGLGKSYINNASIKWHKSDIYERMYVNLKDGKKATMPRYYKDKIYTREERGDLKAYHTNRIREETELELLLYKTDDTELLNKIRDYKESVKAEYNKLKLNAKNRKN